jgi:alpha-glucosidase
MLLLTLRGTPTLYYGDEIGMENVPIPPERERDPFGMNMPGTGQGRDPERTPMQWDASPNAGFTTGAEPWLPLAADWRENNVEAQRRDPRSMLSLVEALLRLRRAEPALSSGSYRTLSVEGDVLVYARVAPSGGRRAFVVALNLTPEPRAVAFARGEMPGGRVALSTRMDRGASRWRRRAGWRCAATRGWWSSSRPPDRTAPRARPEPEYHADVVEAATLPGPGALVMLKVACSGWSASRSRSSSCFPARGVI